MIRRSVDFTVHHRHRFGAINLWRLPWSATVFRRYWSLGPVVLQCLTPQLLGVSKLAIFATQRPADR